MTTEELDALLETWQKRLRLSDWEVTAKFVRQRDLDNHPYTVGGECDFVILKKRAQINILDPVDYPTNCLFPEDHELVLVHELLHLHMAPLEDGIRFEEDNETETPEWIAVEQAIHAISSALVAAYREGKA